MLSILDPYVLLQGAGAAHQRSASAATTIAFQPSPSPQGGRSSPQSATPIGANVAPAFDISPTDFDPNDQDQDDTYAALSHEYSSITRFDNFLGTTLQL